VANLLHELVNLRRLLTTAANGYVDPVRGEDSTWLHDTKADIVQNCLFGVDIQQQAIEICRLRLWLSMVVDYDLGLEPLGSQHSCLDGGRAVCHTTARVSKHESAKRVD
jgi:hypothetical protein